MAKQDNALGLLLVIALPALAAGASAARHGSASRDGSEVVLTVDAGQRGKLVVTKHAGNDPQAAHFSFELVPRNSPAGPKLWDVDVGEHDEVIDAALTSDPALVVVYRTATRLANGSLDNYTYSADIIPMPESRLALPPWRALPNVLLWDDGKSSPFKSRVTGSLKGGDLMLHLTGRERTLRFGFDITESGGPGWYFVEGQKPPPGSGVVAKIEPLTRPAPPIDHTARAEEPAPPPAPRSHMVLRHEYGERGTLVVNFTERQTPRGRNVAYVFLLEPPRGGQALELDSDEMDDEKPIGGGESTRSLVDAHLLGDCLIEVSKFNSEDELTMYMLSVVPPDALKNHMPKNSAGFLYTPEGRQPARKAEVRGSLKDGITLRLVGPKDTFRFQFLMHGDHAGWHEADDFTRNSWWIPPWERGGATTRPAPAPTGH